MGNQLVATGRVESLCVDGKPVPHLWFNLDGPEGDKHSGFTRKASGHDGGYMRTSGLKKGNEIFNTRSWTGLSLEELRELSDRLEIESVPTGCLLENIVFSGIPGFSQLPPTSRIVFPNVMIGDEWKQAILTIWEENEPCGNVGTRLETLFNTRGLSRRFIQKAKGLRGVMGIVYSAGLIEVGNEVLVYPPMSYY